MEPREYVDARWSALVRAAVLLGASEAEAPAVVRRVLAEQERRIRRARDPDPLVHRALVAAIPGAERTAFGAEPDLEARRGMLIDAEDVAEAPVGAAPPASRRRWPVALAVAALLAVATGAVLTAEGEDDPPDDRLAADQVPSLFGYDAAVARTMLRARGLEVEVEPFRACEVRDRVVGADPPAGTTYEPGDPITLYSALPADVTCLTNYQDIAAAWAFLDFANGRGPAPRFASRVFVYVGDAPATVLTRAEDVARWAGTEVLTSLRRASAQVALVSDEPLTYALPTLRVSDASSPSNGCGAPDPSVAARGEAISLTIGAPAGRTSCPVRVDLYRTDDDLIDAVVLYPSLS